uniref:RHS repeat-associated core domain-containing protein n=1 Tax=Streptomyces triticirhizae TaxID=2483353 RepID=UPI001F374CBA|nr:RHS repeat-associated core domain-containing protein [Streptomyces triticirhizae]
MGRITGIGAPGWEESYAYDAAGNQTAASWPSHFAGSESTGERDYTGTRLVRAGAIHYEHDAAGRVVPRRRTRLSRRPDVWRYTWDAEDRLTSVTTPDGTLWRYLYDGFGRRVAKRRMAADGETVLAETRFTWDGGVLVEQHTTGEGPASGTVLTWEHDGLRPLAQTERLTDDTAQRVVDARFFAIVTDLVGAPTELVDEEGHTAWSARSTAWGLTAWRPGATGMTPLRFPGQYHDPESGLHYNVNRYYDPHTARYASQDPLGLLPGLNPDGYVPNPQVEVDPLGLADYDIPWSSGRVSRAARELENGATSVTMGSRSEVEELFLGVYQGQGYRNATGFDGPGTRQYFGEKRGTYHWDDQLGEGGRVLGHGPGNRDGDLPHLQIHTFEGPIVRVFWTP